MSTMSFEGIVRQDQIQLPAGVHLPDETKVIVVVPPERSHQTAQVFSPRLANPAQATDFVLEVIEENTGA